MKYQKFLEYRPIFLPTHIHCHNYLTYIYHKWCGTYGSVKCRRDKGEPMYKIFAKMLPIVTNILHLCQQTIVYILFI